MNENHNDGKENLMHQEFSSRKARFSLILLMWWAWSGKILNAFNRVFDVLLPLRNVRFEFETKIHILTDNSIEYGLMWKWSDVRGLYDYNLAEMLTRSAVVWHHRQSNKMKCHQVCSLIFTTAGALWNVYFWIYWRHIGGTCWKPWIYAKCHILMNTITSKTTHQQQHTWKFEIFFMRETILLHFVSTFRKLFVKDIKLA